MEQLRNLVDRATGAPTRDERIAAYGHLVDRFRDMACGYAYSMLSDFHLAEDAAQDAFITAFRTLDQLRQPEAFPGWFRRIVFSACTRIQRRETPPAAGIEAAADVAAFQADPADIAEENEMKNEVLQAIRQLPNEQREATMLFYINGYSQRDISEFLEVPVSTVKNRLHASRAQLKERMLTMVKDTLHTNAPDERFNLAVIDELLARPRPLDIEGHPVRQIWDDFKDCFRDFQLIHFEEVVSRKNSHLIPDIQKQYGYGIDEDQILRTDLSDQLIQYWTTSGGNVGGFVSAGRIFRKGSPSELQQSANLFHQAEILWISSDFTDETPILVARKIASHVLHEESVTIGKPVDCGGGLLAHEISVTRKGIRLDFAVAGFHSSTIFQRTNLDSKKYRALCLCLGLERCAMIRFGIDDIRQLWQPPYVQG